MRNLTRLAYLAGLLFTLGMSAPVVHAKNYVQNYPKYHATVDWSRAVALVQGSAPRTRGMATRAEVAAARRNAFDNLVALAVAIVPITGSNQRRLAMVAAVRKEAARCKISTRKQHDRLMVTLTVPLVGDKSLSSALLPYLREKSPFVPAKAMVVASRGDGPALTGEEDMLTPADARGPFTGLIVDARGYSVQRTMCPILYDPQDKEIYSGGLADADFVEDIGVVGYTNTIKAAVGASRVGKTPLVVRATGSPDESHRHVSLSEADAKRIQDADNDGKFLKKCAVVFVVDNSPSSEP